MKLFGKILTVTLILTLTQLSFSQESSSGLPFNLSPRLSFGVSNFYGHQKLAGLHLKASYSFDGGVIFSFPLLGNRLSADPALQYSYIRANTEWSKNNTIGSKTTRTATVSDHNIDIPVMLKLDLGKIFIELGPKIGFILASNTLTDEGAAYGGKFDGETPKANLFMFGGAAGIGYEIIPNFSLDIRGTYDIREYAENTYGKPWTLHLGIRYQVL